MALCDAPFTEAASYPKLICNLAKFLAGPTSCEMYSDFSLSLIALKAEGAAATASVLGAASFAPGFRGCTHDSVTHCSVIAAARQPARPSKRSVTYI